MFMKILLIGNYPPPYGGIAVHVQLLQRLLMRYGIDCDVVNIDPRSYIKRDLFGICGRIILLYKIIKLGKDHLIHLHTNGHNLKSWLMVAIIGWLNRLLGRTSLLTIHSGMASAYIVNSNLRRRLLIRLALMHQSLIISVNHELLKTLQCHGYQDKKIILMPAFLFDDQDQPLLASTDQQLLTNFNPLLSAVAFYRPEYGLELLIAAVALLKKQFPEIGCVVMGSGEGREKLIAETISAGVAEQFIWFGDLEHSKCLSVIRNSQLFVRPTLADGDAISVREAIQLRVPVVASDVGYRPSSVILFKSGDAIDLANKCNFVLANLSSTNQCKIDDQTSGYLIDLINLYKELEQSSTETSSVNTINNVRRFE